MKGKANRFDRWREAFGRSRRRVVLSLTVGILLIGFGGLYALLGDTLTLAIVLITLGLLITFAAAFTIGV